MIKQLCALLGAVFLAACATPYQEMGFGGGVDAQMIDARTARISARGNGYTDAAVVKDHALLKAAESTLEAGYRYFSISSSSDASRTGTVVVPGHSNTTMTANVYGNTGYGSAYTTYTPAQAYNFIKPGQDIYISMYKQPANGVFDANEVRKHLGARYIKKKN